LTDFRTQRNDVESEILLLPRDKANAVIQMTQNKLSTMLNPLGYLQQDMGLKAGTKVEQETYFFAYAIEKYDDGPVKIRIVLASRDTLGIAQRDINGNYTKGFDCRKETLRKMNGLIPVTGIRRGVVLAESLQEEFGGEPLVQNREGDKVPVVGSLVIVK